jgi:hypothetical protein
MAAFAYSAAFSSENNSPLQFFILYALKIYAYTFEVSKKKTRLDQFFIEKLFVLVGSPQVPSIPCWPSTSRVGGCREVRWNHDRPRT